MHRHFTPTQKAGHLIISLIAFLIIVCGRQNVSSCSTLSLKLWISFEKLRTDLNQLMGVVSHV